MGRTFIGGKATMSLGEDLLAWVDDYAASLRLPRAEATRLIITQYAIDRARAAGGGHGLVDVLVDGRPTPYARGPRARRAPAG